MVINNSIRYLLSRVNSTHSKSSCETRLSGQSTTLETPENQDKMKQKHTEN